ncbi:MAG: DinB family protein, partial [Pseudomonadales bacterium]
MTLLAGATAYDSRDYLRAQAYNNAVANHRLLGACAQLDADDLNRKRVSFFPTIVHTWNHILTVDWYYISALEGHSVGPGA